MKRELRRFSGFNFDEQSQEFAKKHKMLVGLKTKELGLIQSAFRKFYWPEDKKDRDAYVSILCHLLKYRLFLGHRALEASPLASRHDCFGQDAS